MHVEKTPNFCPYVTYGDKTISTTFTNFEQYGGELFLHGATSIAFQVNFFSEF